VIHHIFETLVAIGRELQTTRTSLASKVVTGADAKTFTFTLRKGVEVPQRQGRMTVRRCPGRPFERYKKVSPGTPSVLADVDSYDTTRPIPSTFGPSG